MESSTGHGYMLYIGSAGGWTGSLKRNESPTLYVQIKVDESAVQNTEIIEQNKAPTWDEKFVLNGNPTSIISLVIKHRECLIGEDPCIGRVDIPIGTLLERCAEDKSAILKVKSEAVGENEMSVGDLTVKFGRLPTVNDSIGEDLAADLSEVGTTQLDRFDDYGDIADLEGSISNLRKAVELTDDGHPDKPRYFFNLGLAKGRRFERFGELVDIADAISNQQEAVQLTDDGHPEKLRYLSGLGLSHQSRYEHVGELTDLNDAISNQQKTVRLANDEHPDKLRYISNLGNSQLLRFVRFGELMDVEDAISNLKASVMLTEDGHPDKAMYLSNLGINQRVRYDRLGEIAYLEESVLNLQRAVDLTNDGHPDKPGYFYNLGNSQRHRYWCLGELTDLEGSVSNLRKAVDLTDDGHPDKPRYFSILGAIQQNRYQHLGELTDLEDAILNLKTAVQFTEDRHPLKPMHLANLCGGQLTYYRRLGELADLEDCISNLQKAVRIMEDGHTFKPACLSNLGCSQLCRYEHLGELIDLEESISNLRRAVRLTMDGDICKPGYLINLSSSQLKYYESLGELADLEDCVSNLQDAAQLMEDGHTDKPLCLSNLGLSQRCRYERLGELNDLDESISNLRKAVELTHDGHPDQSGYLSNLGISQRRRFERLSELADLEDAISNSQKAVWFADDKHPDKLGYLSNLSISQLGRFEGLGELTDLEDAISNLAKVVQLTEDGHPNKSIYLSNLGLSQRSRYEHFKKLPDLEGCILNLCKAVQLTEDGHTNKPSYLGNLGLSQRDRYERLGELTSLNDAMSNLQKAIQLTEDEHPDKARYLASIGSIHDLRFKRLREQADFLAAVSAFKSAAQLNAAHPLDAFFSARQWAETSYRNGDLSSALDGCRTALTIFPKVAWMGIKAASRQNILFQGDSENLSCLSATCAIQLGHLEEAVELLDMGRSVFWQQASSLRSDLEMLKEVAPELADQLDSVGRMLDVGNFSGSLLDIQEHKGGINSTENLGKKRRHLVGVWEELVEQVRQLPKFELFLRPIPFCQLRQAAAGGQIVIINSSHHRVDALIFDAERQIEHVPLPNADVETLWQFARDIVLQRPRNASTAQVRSYTAHFLKPALRTVWNHILIPIFDKIQVPLNGNSGVPQRRIWWYPTGPLTFIPIHAAGLGKGEIDTSRLVISSYVTTLSSLFQSQKKQGHGTMRQPKLLAVSQPDTPGQGSLPLSTKEVDKIVEVVSLVGWPKENIVHLNGSDATVDRVLRVLDSCSWIHLACHGIQHQTLNMNSAFALSDGNLELSQIASKRLSTGQFAFLSVCHAAAGLRSVPGEAMHLVGGLQFAGFPSIIATMWGICDKDAPIVAQHTYQYLFRNGLQACDPSEAAVALNHAVQRLREDTNVTLDRWAPFIHFGI